MRSTYLISLFLLSAAQLSFRAQALWTVPREYALYASPNGHFFQCGDGSPFFWQVDTAWMLFSRLTLEEADQYLADRARKGFTMIQAAGAQFSGIDVPNRAGDLTFEDNDPERPNEKYWAHVDSVIRLAWEEYGIRIAMIPAWGSWLHDGDNEAGVLNSDNAATFGEFIGRRYPYLPKILFGDTNPSWKNKTQVLDEYLHGGVPSEYETIDWSLVYDALADGLHKGEAAVESPKAEEHGPQRGSPYKPLISIHPQNQWFTGGPLALASSYFGGRDWLTFDVVQSGHGDSPPHPPVPWWNCRRGWEPVERMYALGSKQGMMRPVLDNEPHYEWRYNNANASNFYWNASDVRTGAWQSVFSGAAGLAYGADMVWQMYVPGVYEPETGGPAIAWYDAIKLPGSEQMQYIKKAVLDRGNDTYFNRVPAQDIIIGNPGTDDQRITATRDAKGSWIMVYVPTSASFSVETKSLHGCKVKASWFDPTAGAYKALDYVQCDGSGSVKQFQTPSSENHTDWTLVLEVV